MKISVVVNTYNEEKNIRRCLESVKSFADEIVLVDMHSTDKTVELAKKYGVKVFQHEYTRYVEPARNFALAKANGNWILLVDADEEIPPSLIKRLKELTGEECDFVRIPRKNVIFGKWIKNSRWWPDFLVRFFKKGAVSFSEKIHCPPQTKGKELTLEPLEENAIVHHHIQSVSQFVERVNRYTDVQSQELIEKGYQFDWKDLLLKPSNEFFSRFFAGEGYKDGLHGLALSFLQAFSEFIVYLKVWEQNGFKENKISDSPLVFQKIIRDFFFWEGKVTSGIYKKLVFKIKSRL